MNLSDEGNGIDIPADKEGVAVILCDTQQRQKYLQLGASLSMLESSLHHSLPEHLNSEIVLGAITDVQTAHEWLKSTFLFKRIQLNPAYYGIAKTSPNQTWGSRFDDLVEEALLNLETNKLLDKSESGGVTATAFGNIASRSYVKQASMSLIIDLPESASKKDVVSADRRITPRSNGSRL
jgi:ATP-dependent DNA helicase HFM1/MER3